MAGTPYADHAARPVTSDQAAYAVWLKDKTGYDVDVRSVALAFVLREPWRQSPEHRAHLGQRKAENAARKTVAGRKGAPPPKEFNACTILEDGLPCTGKDGEPAEAHRLGMCDKHYRRQERWGDPLIRSAAEAAAKAAEVPARRVPRWPA